MATARAPLHSGTVSGTVMSQSINLMFQSTMGMVFPHVDQLLEVCALHLIGYAVCLVRRQFLAVSPASISAYKMWSSSIS